MQSFYDTCDSEAELKEFLETASVKELADLLDTINYRIHHDDTYSPLWEYRDEIQETIEGRKGRSHR